MRRIRLVPSVITSPFGGLPPGTRIAVGATLAAIRASGQHASLPPPQSGSSATLQASACWLAYRAVASISARRASTMRRTMASGSWWSAE